MQYVGREIVHTYIGSTVGYINNSEDIFMNIRRITLYKVLVRNLIEIRMLTLEFMTDNYTTKGINIYHR